MRLQRDEYEYTVFIYTDYTCMRKANTVSVFDDLDTLQPRFQRISSKTSEVCVCGGVACRGRHRRAPVQQHMPRAFPRAGRVGQAEGHLRPVACRGRHRRAPVQSTCHGPFLERGVSVGRKVACRPVACRGRHRRAPVQKHMPRAFPRAGRVGRAEGHLPACRLPREASPRAVRACDLPEATHTPMAWPVAPCFLPACRLPGEASPRACAKAQAAGLCRARRVGRTAAAGHLQGWALGPACPSPAAVYSDLKKTIPLTT
jgi:hypothetical protein